MQRLTTKELIIGLHGKRKIINRCCVVDKKNDKKRDVDNLAYLIRKLLNELSVCWKL